MGQIKTKSVLHNLHANIRDFNLKLLFVNSVEWAQHFAIELQQCPDYISFYQWFALLNQATQIQMLMVCVTFSTRHKIAIGGIRFASSTKLYLRPCGETETVSPMSINRTRIDMFVGCDKTQQLFSVWTVTTHKPTHLWVNANGAEEFLV